MRREVQEIAAIDRIIHEPARLAIVAVLSACASADFKSLLDLTGLSKGNLSAQLQKLEEAGYVSIEKGFQGRYPHTTCALTPPGRQAFQQVMARYRNLDIALSQPDDL